MAEKAVKALFEHRGLTPGTRHRFGMLADMLSRDDEWFARINILDNLSPAATTLARRTFDFDSERRSLTGQLDSEPTTAT
jgi:hypothetical protein